MTQPAAAAATTGRQAPPLAAASRSSRKPATLLDFVRSYPVAVVALLGIVAGAAVWAAGFGPAARWILAAASVVGAAPLVWETIRQMLRGQFNVDLIAAVAAVGAIALGEYLAAALVVLMQAGGEALEDYGLRRANDSLDNLLRRAPSVAYRRREQDGEYEEVAAADIRPGDRLLVRRGDILAADGVVVEGAGSVDESALTGEPVPLAKAPGDPVFSGTIDLTGSFEMRATSAAAQSKYERIVRMVQSAQGEHAPIHRLADRYTPPFTILTFVAAALAWFLTHDPTRALSVLVVATPCPLIIATPLAVITAINRAAAENVIFKSGAALERAGDVNVVMFDKTGTLTVGTPDLSAVRLVTPSGETVPADTDPQRRDSLLAAAAAVEVHSGHVLGSAVVRAARAAGRPIPDADGVFEAPGTGVGGEVEGRRYVIGSGRFLIAQGAAVPDAAREERLRLSAQGGTVAYLAEDGIVVALLAFADRVRPGSAALVARLRQMGVDPIVMLTGDAPETAEAVAAQVGIADVRARMQPETKLAAIAEMRGASGGGGRPRRTVMMVGDGINDAPALAAADVGTALGGYGAGIATDAADIVITVDQVERVADAIAIGRRMVTVATQGIFAGMGVSLILMAIAGTGWIAPAVGALLQELLDLATILNALRTRRG